MNPQDYVVSTVAEFCQRHRMSARKFYYELKAGRLRAIKRGKRTLVTRDEEARYLIAARVRIGGLIPHCIRPEEDPERANSVIASNQRRV